MENLFLPEIDYSEASEFNIKPYSYWSLKNDCSEDYLFLENAFSSKECLEIIKIGKQTYFEQSKTNDGRSFSDSRKSKNSWITPSEFTRWIYERIDQKIKIGNEIFNFDLHSVEPLQFTEYHSEYKGKYEKHIDKFYNSGNPNDHRKLSFSIQLSNVCEYEGGELALYNCETPIIGNKNIGCINFFPSYILHEVKPVTKGVRYSLVGWAHGPKFK